MASPAQLLKGPSHRLTDHTGIVNSVAFSPNGKLLASGSGDNSVCLYDISNYQKMRMFIEQDILLEQALLLVALFEGNMTIAEMPPHVHAVFEHLPEWLQQVLHQQFSPDTEDTGSAAAAGGRS